MAVSKNVGQVSGLFIGTSAPSNRTLIWYDSTPAIRAHKVYNESLGAWVMLDNTVISNITYSELVGIASGTGLVQGAWFKITDRGNALALAISSTKIQYVDLNGNFIIDDLVSTTIYVVNSNNLYFDEQQGVWDTTNNQLKFSFTTVIPDTDSGTDFIYGRRTRLGVTSFVKYTLQSLISAVTGNSITWDRGFYFNFLSELASQMDVNGGIVSKSLFDSTIANLQVEYNNLADSINDMYTDIQTMVVNLTTDSAIFDKQMPYTMVPGTAAPIITGDSLADIAQKSQRWFDQLRFSTGIEVGPNFTPAANESSINSADDVFEALRKIQKALNNRQNSINLLNTFQFAFLHCGVINVRIRHRSATPITDGTLRLGLCVSNVEIFEVASDKRFLSNGTNGQIYSFVYPVNCTPLKFWNGLSYDTVYSVSAPLMKVKGNVFIQIMIACDGTNVINIQYNPDRPIANTIFGASAWQYLSSDTPNAGDLDPEGGALINLKFVGIEDSIWNNGNYNINLSLLTTEE